MQETTRKDVERVFGVLQAHWGIVCGAAICGNQILCGSWWHVVLFCTIWLLTTMVKGQPRTHDFAKHREQGYNLKQDVDHIMNFLKMHQNLGDQICTGNYLIMLWSICGPTMETQNFSVWVVHFKQFLCLNYIISVRTIVLYEYYSSVWPTFMDFHGFGSLHMRSVAVQQYIWGPDRRCQG